jgi:hypothetical protein
MLNSLRVSLLSGAVSLVVVSLAVADISGLIGNTKLHYDRQHPEIVVKIQLNADGSFQALVDRNTTAAGTWREQDGKLCYTITSKQPAGRPNHVCARGMDGKKVGDTWIERWDDGRWYKGRVVAGLN